MIKAVFFDIDGTLVDSNEQHVDAWLAAFAAHGFDLPRQAVHDQMGKGADQLVPALLPDAGDEVREALSQHQARVYARLIGDVAAFPGARDLLRRVADAGRTVVLASSAAADEVAHYLDLLDARGIVAATTSADDVAHTKPCPDIFVAALGKVRPLPPHEVVVVGDSPYDVVAAKAAGIAAVALRSGGFDDDALRAAGAVAVYDDVAALLAGYATSPLAR